MRKPQRPRGKVRPALIIYSRLPVDVVARLDAQAIAEERDRSAIIRRALDAYCAKAAA